MPIRLRRFSSRFLRFLEILGPQATREPYGPTETIGGVITILLTPIRAGRRLRKSVFEAFDWGVGKGGSELADRSEKCANARRWKRSSHPRTDRFEYSNYTR